MKGETKMHADYLIKNGLVIDSSQQLEEIMDIAVCSGRIARVGKNLSDVEDAEIIDASGCIVSAGLIDCHMHLFEGCGMGGTRADAVLLSSGATAGFDGGSAGIVNYALFSHEIVQPSWATIKAYLNVSAVGLATASFFPENVDPKFFDRKRIAACVAQYSSEIVALKIRISKNIVGGFGLEPLKTAVEIGQEVSLPVVVHTTDPAGTLEEIFEILRPGDIYCHAFHGSGHTLLNDDGSLKSCVWVAREKGILFDVANGVGHFAFSVAQAAIDCGFYPDTISTDLTKGSMFKKPVYSLPYTMSKYLNLRMPLQQVIDAVTYRPAKAFGLENEMGTLKEGVPADVTVLRRTQDKQVCFQDVSGGSLIGNELLIPQMTIKNGVIVYRQIDFL